MAEPTIRERVHAAIARQLEVDPATVRDDVTLQSLGAEPLDAFDIAAAIERELDIDIPDDAIEAVVTVDDMVNLAGRQVAAK